MSALKLGDVIDVAERDYMYGTGRLVLRLMTIGDKHRLADGEWLDVDGLELRTDGTQLGPRPRHVLVRLNAVRVRRPLKAQS
jgi:hypothetical protein